MPKIFFHQQYISREEIEENEDLINEILSGRLHSPQVKKLVGALYQKEAVYRAKIDKKRRLIFTYVQHEGKRTLLILAVNNHNYKQLKRQLGGANPELEDVKELELESPANIDMSLPAELTPVVSYNQMTILLDEAQQESLSLPMPLVLSGPPGAGKTAILYNLMLGSLQKIFAEQVEYKGPDAQLLEKPILFVSQSAHLIKQLKEDYKTQLHHDKAPVQFSTWQELYQIETTKKKFVSEEAFAKWVKDHCPDDLASVIHYELSLLAALSLETYLKLGKRQSYFSGNEPKQLQISRLLLAWQSHLQSQLQGHGLIDPMVMPPTHTEMYSSVYCDEAQNLPPVALRYLIERALNNQFIACLDSEQCLITSPYVQNCLKQLLHAHSGGFTQHHLPRTWRCPKAVIDVANRVLNTKYKLDGREHRREYKDIASACSWEGRVSRFDEHAFKKIQAHGALASTVVIAEKISPEDRAFINEHLGTNNILTAKEAIGLDFSVVILWNPFSQRPCLKQLHKYQKTGLPDGLSLEQWNSLNALYVSLTRAQKDVYIFEKDQNLMKGIGRYLLGDLPLNQIRAFDEKVDKQEQEAQWHQLVETYLNTGLQEKAAEIMRFHLHMQESDIADKIMARRPKQQSPSLLLELQKEVKEKKPLLDDKIDEFTITPAIPKSTVANPEKKEPITQPLPTEGDRKKELPPVPKALSPTDKYITDLLQNITEANLTKLLKHKKAAYFLFQYQLEDGSCLGKKLFSEPKWKKHIIQVMFEQIDRLVEISTPAVLCNPCKDRTGVSLLFLLLSSSQGLDILNQMLQKNPQLASGISAEALCRPLPKEAGANVNKSPLYGLSGNLQGLEILNQLLQKNSQLASGISAEALCRPLPKEAGQFANQSPLYFLSSSSQGLEILNQLLQKNPQLASGISAEALCRPLPKAAGANANESPLYWLSGTLQGRETLNQLLQKNPQLASGISAEALCRPIPNEAGTDANKSPLYWLSASSEGREIVNQLLLKNPQLTSGISAEALCRPLPKEAGAKANISLLYWLSSSSQGLEILNQLLQKNSQLVSGISAEALCRPLPKEAGQFANQSPLFWLSASLQGQGLEILNQLLLKNPQLASGISAEALCRPLPKEAGANANISPLYWLSVRLKGLEILNQLLQKNSQLASGISAEALCRPLPKEAGQFANQSPLFWLSASLQGREILNQLLQKNSQLASGISAEALCRPLPKEAGTDANKSPLYWLSASSQGLEILSQLLQQNSDLAPHISMEALLLECAISKDQQIKKSTLSQLKESPDGQEILRVLAKNNSAIKMHIGEGLLADSLLEHGFFSKQSDGSDEKKLNQLSR